MRHYFTAVVFIFLSVVTFSQTKQVLNGNQFATDQFGNYYDIASNTIRMYDRTHQLRYSYSNTILGEIASVDVSNPYKILVYYRDFTKVQMLDNTLSPASEVLDLTSIELEETSLICSSYNNGMWYYNQSNFELIRKSEFLETTNTSGNIALIVGGELLPNYLTEYNNRVYLNDPGKGILVFDQYGTYLKTIPILGLTSFQVKEQFLLYIDAENNIETYHFLTLEQSNYKSEKYGSNQWVRMEGEYLYLVDKKKQLIIDKIQH